MHPYLKNTLIALAISLVILFATIYGLVKYIKSEQYKKEEANAVNVEMIRGKIEKALEERYGLDFEVETPQLQGNEGFGYDTMSVKVWTTGAERFYFGAQWVISEDKLDYDSYISAKMGHEAWKIWEPKLRAYYGDDFNVGYYSFYVKASFEEERYEELKNMNVEEILNKYPEKFIVEIWCYIVTNDFNKDEEAERIYNLTRWLGEEELSRVFLGFFYTSEEKKEEFFKVVGEGRVHYEEMYKMGLLTNSFRIREWDEYNTLEAIKKSLLFGGNEE